MEAENSRSNISAVKAGSDNKWNALDKLSSKRRNAMEFLRDHLPASDLDGYPFELFLAFADHALFLRKNVRWCRELDWEIFCHYVLFPRVNDEDLSLHRQLFYDALWERICHLSNVEEVTLEVNRWCHEIASYERQDDRTASPLTVYRCGSGRCGEESVLLIAALRSVGVPARQVYVPRWSHCDDNHAWVEVLCGDEWHFLGACEPEPVLDLGWFNAAAAQAVLVHSRIFGEGTSPLHGEYLYRAGKVRWYNQTGRYAPVKPHVFRALWHGKSAPGTVFQLQILNEAGFHTIAELTADENGEARTSLGVGDIHVLAMRGDLRAEGDCRNGGITLSLEAADESYLEEMTADQTPAWRRFDFAPPAAPKTLPTGLTPEQKKARADVLQHGDQLRKTSMADFFLPEWQGKSGEVFLRKARGNAREIAAFLRKDQDIRRERLLATLTDKDMRDAQAVILEDHLKNLPEQGELPDELYWPYVACPRISLERLSAWRSELLTDLTMREREIFQADPAALWKLLSDRIRMETEHYYGGLYWTPGAALRACRCDEKSLRVLLVAILRTIGIPARLRGSDGVPEFWHDGQFEAVWMEEMGALQINKVSGSEIAPAYRQNWTLARQTAKGWQALNLSDQRWNGKAGNIPLPAGIYRLITSVRLPDGRQMAAMRECRIAAKEICNTDLFMREYQLSDLLYRRTLPSISARTLRGERIPDIFRMHAKRSLFFWLEEGREPTEHLLNELADLTKTREELPIKMVFLVRDRESLTHPTLAGLLQNRPAIQVLLTEWDADTETVARQLNVDPGQLPLAAIVESDGTVRYGMSGYRAGMAELLIRLIAECAP